MFWNTHGTLWPLLCVSFAILQGAALSAEISVKDFAGIQAAIDAHPGQEISVPAGDYTVDQTIRITGQGTSLVGPGRILMTDPARHILEIEHAANIRVAGLTFSRPEGRTETTEEAIRVADAQDIVLEQLRIIDNHTRSGAIRLQDVRQGRILNCEILNYMTISIDDRTQNAALLGYAFRCSDGTGIVCNRCRGALLQGNRIVEERLHATPELKQKHRLGSFTKKNPVKGSLIAQEVWDAEYVNNWRQGSAIVVTGPTASEFTRILGNQIENAAQGIDLHADRVIVANNIVDNSFVGMKAMHGSRNVLITGNQFSRNVLWAIGLMSGAAAEPAVPGSGERSFTPANVDGGSLIANNIISQFGFGDDYWIWKDASRCVFRFDRGQEPSDPPLRDVLVTGNIISNPDVDELPDAPAQPDPPPRYHYAVRIETGGENAPRGLHFAGNVFPAGSRGVSNVELAP